jgi:hypothetical protein
MQKVSTWTDVRADWRVGLPWGASVVRTSGRAAGPPGAHIHTPSGKAWSALQPHFPDAAHVVVSLVAVMMEPELCRLSRVCCLVGHRTVQRITTARQKALHQLTAGPTTKALQHECSARHALRAPCTAASTCSPALAQGNPPGRLAAYRATEARRAALRRAVGSQAKEAASPHHQGVSNKWTPCAPRIRIESCSAIMCTHALAAFGHSLQSTLYKA